MVSLEDSFKMSGLTIRLRNPQSQLKSGPPIFCVVLLIIAMLSGCSQKHSVMPTEGLDSRPLPPVFSEAAKQTEAPDVDAVHIIRDVIANYDALSTYSDEGTIIAYMTGADSRYTGKFRTLFKRRAKLRVAWAMEFNHTPGHIQNGVVWCDGTSAWVSYSIHGNRVESKENLELATAGAGAASWGAAYTIPRLLSSEVGGIGFDEMKSLTVVKHDTADGVECVVVAGDISSGTQRKIWVGLKDNLIRRIEERSKSITREEVRRHIVVNRDIADSRFSKEGE